MSYRDSVQKVLGALRLDGWRSTLGGLGSRSDRGRPGSIELCENYILDDETLNAAYRHLWLARRLVEIRPEEALREGFGIEDDRVPNFKRLNYSGYAKEGALERCLRMAELKGGAGIFVGYKQDGGPDALLKPAPEGAEVAFLEVFDKFQLQAQERDREIDSPTYDQPTIWQVIGQRRTGLRFHTSRMIRVTGVPLPSDTGTQEQDRDWGDSILQAVWTDLQRYGVFWQSVAHLMQLSSVGVLKIAGLVEMLATQNQDVATARVDLLNESMSITRMMLLDAKHDEDYHREAVSFTDVPALLNEIQLATAGAFKIPATKLFGRAPAGMNATGESDARNWYDDVACYQQLKVLPTLQALLAVTDDIAPDDIEFEPLWQESAAEKANTRKVTIDANERLWTMGVVSEAEIRKAMNEGKDIEELMTGKPPEDAGPEPQAAAPRSPFGLGSPAPVEPAPEEFEEGPKTDAADAIETLADLDPEELAAALERAARR